MEEPIRVLMINYKMQCAGIEAFIMNMYRNMDRSKVQFDFLVHYTERQFYDDEIEELGGKIYRLSIREDNNFYKYFRDLRNFFKDHREYRIVHGHMESFGLFYLKAAKKAGVPVRIAHSHIAEKNKGIKGTIKNILNKSFKKYATDLFACSEIAGDFVFGKDSGYTVYNNAIDVEKFSFKENIREDVRKELQISPEQFVIGHVGRFNTQKNHIFLIDIFSAVHEIDKSAILLLIGEGDLESVIKKKVEELNLTRSVRFLGVRRDVERLYQAMDVFLLPSLFEGLPVSGIEAQAAGLQCVFSDAVTKQTTMTQNVKYVSLDASLEEWTDNILECKSLETHRGNTSQAIIDAGYDIREQARNLQNFYLQKYEEYSKCKN